MLDDCQFLGRGGGGVKESHLYPAARPVMIYLDVICWVRTKSDLQWVALEFFTNLWLQ
jgi:hypothetical protein